jgi:uncharacterized membrane protein
MRKEKITADRLAAFSDGIFAVALTVLVLELKAPDQSAFSALWPLWPTGISYAVSFVFIAIIWINHHHLMRFVGPPTLRLTWMNFIHLFMVSLLPFATAWVARTFTRGCSCASTLPTTSSSAKYSPARAPTKCPSVRGAWRGVDHSLSLQFSRRLCWWRSSRRASASV